MSKRTFWKPWTVGTSVYAFIISVVTCTMGMSLLHYHYSVTQQNKDSNSHSLPCRKTGNHYCSSHSFTSPLPAFCTFAYHVCHLETARAPVSHSLRGCFPHASFYSAFSSETLSLSSECTCQSRSLPSPGCTFTFKEMRLSESIAV